jgi:hypothetical protein
MQEHRTGTQEEWLAERDELLGPPGREDALRLRERLVTARA